MAQINDLLVLGESNLLGAVNAFVSITAPKFIGALQGNADTATKLATGRTLSISGTAGGTAPTFNGTANATLVVPATMSGFTSITSGTINANVIYANSNTAAASRGLIVTRSGAETESVRIGVNDSQAQFVYTNDEASSSFLFQIKNTDTEAGGGANANTATVTFTGASGKSTVTADTFSGALSGNAATATKLQTARTLTISGTAGGTAPSFNGSANVTLSVPATMSGFTKITSTNFTGALTGNADSATLLALHNNITSNSTRSTAASTWGGGVTMTSYVWGQRWIDTGISSDSGDFQLGLRPSVYATGGTELCMMIDGDYYSMGQMVAHNGNSGFREWVAGTTSGPQLKFKFANKDLLFGAIPKATTSASGIVTTGTQSFAGEKTFTGRLIVSKQCDLAGTNSNPALVVGGTMSQPHMEFDDNEIMAKTTDGTAKGPLYLNTDGGEVVTGPDGLTSRGRVYATSYLQSGTYGAIGSYLTVGTYSNIGTYLTVGTTITAGGTIKSTYAGPAFLAEVAAGNWAYSRYSYSGSTYYWDLAVKSNDADGAFQMRPQGAESGRTLFRRNGNVSIGGTTLELAINKVQLTYVASTESLDFVFA